MAAKKKKKKAAKPAKSSKKATKTKKSPAKKSKKTVKAATKRPAKKTKKAAKKVAAKKAPAKKPAKKAAKKQIVGEGDYAATRKFDKDQAGFVARNKASIPAMGKEAEKALEGPEGDSLRDAEATAAGHSRDTF
jgi:hypothetical protein